MIAVVLGTRPEIVKMSPVIKECRRQGMDYFILHTGQHYDYNMDGIFFEELGLPAPKYNLGVGSGTFGQQMSRMSLGLEGVLLDERPDFVLVEGDTNTCVVGALVASKLHIKVGQVEAGLRSYDRLMPEEINRLVVDHSSDVHFCPTERAKANLLHEGIDEKDINVTGNTIVDVVHEYAKGLRPCSPFILATVHRQENVDSRTRFAGILDGLNKVMSDSGLRVVYPIHPRAQKMRQLFGLDGGGIEFIEPVGLRQCLAMEESAKLILTDSGGIQEEACVLGTPCVTLRDNTERPETIEVGANMLAGADAERIRESAKIMMGRTGWLNPIGDGHAAERIVNALRRFHG